MQHRALRLTYLACLALVAVSCASFPENKMPLVADLPDQSRFTSKPSVYFAIRFVSDLSGGKEPPRENAAPLPRMREILGRVSKEASMFGSYTFESFEATKTDYVLQIEITNYGSLGSAVGAGLITGFTFFLIPTAGTDNYRLDAKLLDRDRKILKTFSYEDAITTWFGIWMLPLAGKTVDEAFGAVFENMTRTLFRDLLRNQLLPYSLLHNAFTMTCWRCGDQKK
jgi:hypothetical protein